jgi:REP element-mobilizing transposase RayT
VPHRRRERFKKKPVHVTLRAVDGLPSLRRGRVRRALVRILSLACIARGFRITDWSIQNEHLHLICEGRSEQELSRRLQGLSSRLARRLNQLMGREGTFWRERYHARVLHTPREVRNALVYVIQNGKHHPMGNGRGPIPEGCLDACSSALYFDGWREPVPRPPPEDRPPVAKPATWLRATGWRRRGLLSVHESPAPTVRDGGRRRCSGTSGRSRP